MKNLKTIITGLIVGALALSCEKDESIKTTCDSKNGVEVTNQLGRIYKWTRSEPNFFYIGNVQPVTTGVNGGYISCTELPTEFQTEDLIVVYNGIDKGPTCEACDPLFWFISLSSIKKSE